MKIHNVRIGLATNSSSTHSIVFLPAGYQAADREIGDFGWNMFTAASRTAKKNYLAVVLHDALKRECGEQIAGVVADTWTGPRVDGSYIDHQSSITLPRGWDGKGINKEFFDDFSAFLMRDEVAILGGNDNDDARHELLSVGKDLSVREAMPIENHDTFVARKDPTGFWTLFSRGTGTKLRVSFDSAQSMVAAPKRSATPELIDLKITDWCDIGCRYCYQGSTVKGQHADNNTLDQLMGVFERMKVFEVAIGGGEPTTHPNFADVLANARRCGIVPNFTTKSMAWMKDEQKREDILRHCGAFAFSIETAEELRELLKKTKKFKIGSKRTWQTGDDSRNKMIVQHVMGTDASREAFEELLRTCSKNHIEITLLGYKRVGRGKSLNAKKYDWWLDAIKKLRDEKVYVGIGIDTALASEYGAEIERAGVHASLYSIHEGAFSMYVDAVSGQIGPSSYHVGAMRKAEFVEEEILKHYQSLAFAVVGSGASV